MSKIALKYVKYSYFKHLQLMDFQRFTVRLSKRNATLLHTVVLYVQIHEAGNPHRIYRSTNIKIPASEFVAQRQRLKTPHLNAMAQKCLRDVWAVITELYMRNPNISIQDIKRALDGVEESKLNVCDYGIMLANEDKENISASTYKNYVQLYGNFCKLAGLKDVNIKQLTYKLILEAIQKAKKVYAGSTLKLCVKRLNTVMVEARRRGAIIDNPMEAIDLRKLLTYEPTPVVYPSYALVFERLKNDDSFYGRCAYFQLLSGVAIVDLKKLSPLDIQTKPSGEMFIQRARQKTKKRYQIILTPVMFDILSNNNFTAINDKRYNEHLNKLVGVTSHQIRHIFAVEKLQQGFSLEDIAVMLGHSRTDTTLIYAPLDGKLLSNEGLGLVG